MPPDPLVLGFDTSAAHCAAAVVSGEQVLACRIEPMERGQAERLMDLLESVLADAGRGWTELSGLGVGVGPGNFTGVRIAVAAARGLGLGLGVPAVGVTGFDAAGFGHDPRAIRLVDARKGALWVEAEGLPAQLWSGEPLPVDLSGRDAVGHGAEAVAALTGGKVRWATLPLPVAIARIAAGRLGTPQPRPAPLYVRAPDAAPSATRPPVMLP